MAVRETTAGVWAAVCGLLALSISQFAKCATEIPGFLTYPDVQGDRIAFVYLNDLWIGSPAGGVARRLTADGRPKADVRLAPDGGRVAYTMTVEGNPDVYVIGANGGEALRVTHHPFTDRALGWYPDGSSVLIASRLASPHVGVDQMFRVSARGGLAEPIPLAYGETAAFSADGRRLVYTSYRDFQDESWKRYRGGRAPHLRLFDFGSGTSKLLTEGEYSDSSPVWVGNTVYFLSERGPEHRSNLWSLSLDEGSLAQITHYQDFDIRHPAGSIDGIAFEHGGHLEIFDPRSHQVRQLAIEIPTELPGAAKHRVAVGAELETAIWGPSSEQAIIAAHGELFLAGLADGPTINITQTSNAAERYPAVSNDGRRLAYFSDATGEYQLYVREMPRGAPVQITHFSSGMHFQPRWSPDNRHVAFIDSSHDISVVDTRSSKISIIDHDVTRDPDGLERFRVSWSPDGRWLAYSRVVETGNSAVFLYDMQLGRRTQVTSGQINEQDPLFDPSGRVLFLTAAEALQPTFGDIDSTWTFADSMRIVALALRSGTMPSWSNECKCLEYDTGQPVRVDLQDLERRRVELPVERGVITELRALPGRLVYRRVMDAVEGQGVGRVEVLDLIGGRVQVLAPNVDELLDADAMHGVLFRRGVHLAARAYAADVQEQGVGTDRLFVIRNRTAENEQQLRDAWRYARDFFYDKNMQGVDWSETLRRYLPLARRAVTDDDMSFVLRELAGELSAGHTWAYSGHGHPPGWSDACVGLLGADFTVSADAYQISRIYDAGVIHPQLRSPLTDPALRIHAGTFVLAVNGTPMTVAQDPWAAFDGECETRVELTVNEVPTLDGARTVRVRTLRSEAKLREADWARTNRQWVHEISGGRIGYIYVPDTSTNGITELIRQYRAEFRRQGLVVDERFNRGGAFGDRLVELLNRPPLGFFAMRDAQSISLPELANGGPKTLLINGWSYSGGDGFPFLFHAAHAGTIIGTQTAGGYIGPGNPFRLTSGGVISVPVQRAYGADGAWAGAGRGMTPDIQVDDDPADMARGHDHQLKEAVEFLLHRIASSSQTWIPAPPVEKEASQ